MVGGLHVKIVVYGSSRSEEYMVRLVFFFFNVLVVGGETKTIVDGAAKRAVTMTMTTTRQLR